LLDAVVEKVEVFTAQTTYELPARVGDDDSDVDAVHADTDLGRGLDGLLGESERREQKIESEEESIAASRGKKHGLIWHRRMAAKKTEAPSRAEFPERGTGLTISGRKDRTLNQDGFVGAAAGGAAGVAAGAALAPTSFGVER
jgi:hypothetical protein